MSRERKAHSAAFKTGFIKKVTCFVMSKDFRLNNGMY
jgi:hypothetical protein